MSDIDYSKLGLYTKERKIPENSGNYQKTKLQKICMGITEFPFHYAGY